uniref:Uncharacterized protein n=1 Tax=Rhizophora mucronata TaxID=61149 RepID=A0A2P2PEW0_RHIMU
MRNVSSDEIVVKDQSLEFSSVDTNAFWNFTSEVVCPHNQVRKIWQGPNLQRNWSFQVVETKINATQILAAYLDTSN